MKAAITPEGIICEALRCKNALYEGAFPLHVFPTQLANIVRATNECLNFPVDYTASSLCFTISVCAGNLFAAKVKEGWIEHPILYVALIGRPGTNKKPSSELCLAAIIQLRQSDGCITQN
ncbi:hypothetical protein EZS27_030539 [termite gut metagenome]|uniref:DUF3987 domain-containing protein n=1 Tax=termite gut metagenome TaxID=433724 RepID=A0A5J4QC76_9ZZZZ